MKFGKRIDSLGPIAWASENVNYKQLKKALKLHASPDSEFAKAEGNFVTAVLIEVQKVPQGRRCAQARGGRWLRRWCDLCAQVDTFFSRKAAELEERTRQLGVHKSALRAVLLAVVHARCGAEAGVEALTRDMVVAWTREAAADVQASGEVLRLSDFFDVCEDTDNLRKFGFLNVLALTKILKKHDKNSQLHLRESLLGYVQTLPLYRSTVLASVWCAGSVDGAGRAAGDSPHALCSARPAGHTCSAWPRT